MTTDSIWQKIARARKQMSSIPRNGKNPRFNTPYALLSDIESVAVPALDAEGLFVTASGDVLASGPALTVRIVDTESGASVECIVPLVGLDDMQKVVAGFTYARRAGFVALLHLETGEHDDDGNSTVPNAAGRGQGSTPSRPQPAPRPSQGSGTAANPTKPQKGQDGAACPSCGITGMIRRIQKGKDAGLWRCMKWEEKGFHGCDQKFTYDPAGVTEQAQAAKAQAAEVDARIAEEPPLSDNDLPF